MTTDSILLIIIFTILALVTEVFTVKVMSVIVKRGKYSASTVLSLIWAYLLIVSAYALMYVVVDMLCPATAFRIENPLLIRNPFHIADFFEIMVFWLHYSVLVFTNTEVAGIMPINGLSKIIVMAEIVTKLLFSFLVVNTFIKKDRE